MATKTVVVTGFGPFGEYKVNASWECVKQLKEIGLGDHIDLIIYEIPVEYSTVRTNVPQLWDIHKPDLVVHVGVSGIATDITLEQVGYNSGYSRQDVRGEAAENLCCVEGGVDCIEAGLDMHQVSSCVTQAQCRANAVVSKDAGRYLCEFSFFTSLHINRDRTAFIHVPPLDKPYSCQELAEGLQIAIVSLLQQAEQKAVV